MNIIFKSDKCTAKDLYDLTMNPEIQKMASIKGDTIEIDVCALYEDTNSKGEIQRIFSCRTKTGEIFATNSPTFTGDFDRMRTMFAEFGEEVHSIQVVGGVSKSGREYITCKYIN